MELFDLYDKDRNKIGKPLPRGQAYPEGTYHLAVEICVFNSRGKVLIQQRQTFKEGYPGLWTLSAGGSAVAGELSWQAAQRELKEELGIDVDFSALRPHITEHFDEGFNDIYIIIRDVELADLHLQEEEVKDARWATQEEILHMIETGEFLPYRPALIPLLFDLQNGFGFHTA